MDDFVGGVCVLLALAGSLLVMFMIVRGIWRAIFKTANTASYSIRRCPSCGVELTSATCTTCGWQPAPGSRTPTAALNSLRSHLTRLANEGVLPGEMHERLLAAVAAEEARLAATAPKPTATSPFASSSEPAVAAEVNPDLAPVAPPAPPAKPPVAPQITPPPPVSTPAAAPSEPAYVIVAEAIDDAPTQQENSQRTAMTAVGEAEIPAQKTGLGNLLSAFMEEKNVRWGELVGGLLIVGGSVALVISFWAEIAARPLLKFGLFNGVAGALFALGFYTARKWKLPTTSRGVLAIATLLVPLNFLSIAAFTRGALASDPRVIIGELLSLALFSVLVYLGARSIVTPSPLALAVGVLGASISSLLVRRWIALDASDLLLYTLAGMPIAFHFGAVAVLLARLRREVELDEPAINALLRMLGLTAFAALPPCGLLFALSGNIAETMQRLAPLVTVAGAPTMAAGLMLWRRVQNAELAGLRTAGTALAVLGSLIMLAGVALAWPEPALLIAVAGLNFIVLTAVALAFELSAAHLLAGVALALAYLVFVHLMRGELTWRDVSSQATTHALLSATSGNALTALALFYGIAAALWRRVRRTHDALYYAIVAAAAAVASLALVSLYGFRVAGDPYGATWIYAFYAIAAFACSLAPLPRGLAAQPRVRRIRQAAAFVGAAIFALAMIQGVVYRPSDSNPWSAPWTTAAVLHGLALCALAALATALHNRRAMDTADDNASTTEARDALLLSGLISSAVATLLVLFDLRTVTPLDGAIHLSLLAITWLLAARLWRAPVLFDAFQAAIFAASTLAVAEFASHQDWYATTSKPWLDPRMLQMLGCAFAAICLAFTAARLFVLRGDRPHALEEATSATTTRHPTLHAFLVRPDGVSVDHFATGVVLLILLGLATYAALPGMQQELTTQNMVQAFANESQSHLTNDSGRLVPAPSVFEIEQIPHLHAREFGSWLLAALTALLLGVGLWEKVTLERVLGLIVTSVAVCPLIAAHFEVQVAVASALRWLLATYFALGSMAVLCRTYLQRLAHRVGWRGIDDLHSAAKTSSIALLTTLAVVPLLGQTLHVVVATIDGDPVLGPSPTSLFARIGGGLNYALPTALVGLVFVLYALRERSAAFAFAGGLFANLSASVAWMLTAGATLAVDSAEYWTQLGQLNALVASAFGLAWLAVVWWFARRRNERHATHPLLGVQAVAAIALNLLVLLPASLTLFGEPAPVPLWLPGVAAPLGVTAMAVALLFALLVSERRTPLVSISLVAIGLWSAATLMALYSAGWDTGNWLAYHTLIAARTVTPVLLLSGAWLWYRGVDLPFRDRRRQVVTLWAVLAIPLVVLLALRGYLDDPLSLWWSSIPIKATALVAVLIALWSFRRRYLYLAGGLLLLTTTVWYLHNGNVWRPTGDQDVLGFFYFHVLALAAPVIAWLAIELRWIRPRRDLEGTESSLPFHRPATWLSIITLGLVSIVMVLNDFDGRHLGPLSPLGYATLAVVAIAALACLWDSRAREAVFALYVFGLVLVSNYLDTLNLEGDTLVWRGAIALGAFNLATSYLWSRRAGLRLLADRLRMPRRPAARADGLAWLVPVTTLSITLVLLLVYSIELISHDRLLRITAAQAAIAQAFALAFLARGERAGALRLASLAVGTLGMVALGWSWIDPSATAPLLARSVATCVALVATAIIYSIGLNLLPRRAQAWIDAGTRFVPVVVAALAVSVVVVLAQEVLYFVRGEAVPLEWHGIFAVAVALGALFFACLSAALALGRDPLSLSERGRMAYVYAAEVVLALLFLHIRVTMPWIFTGRFQQFWPLIVMAIAFLGVGLGEWFARRRQNVLAQPLERTGILLPLLPVLGFWFFPSGTNYSLVLLVVGSLYATLSVTRKSFGFGVLAALAANGGLWHYLHHVGGVGLLQHPQLWMIPPALCVLAAAYLNRDRLTAAQMTSIRYMTSMTIYLSSTADIFLNGVAQAPWLPLVLAAISLGGIFAGILMRVRAFLFLGTGFLILSIVTIIYHAAVNLNQTWIWAASITVAGVAIIILFAVFEKKREDVQRLVENLRHWQA